MKEDMAVKDPPEIQLAADLQAAQALLRHHRARGLASLHQLFRSGALPMPAPDGRYAGKLITMKLAPGLSQLAQGLANIWMPWLGKTFDATRQSGDNIFTKNSYALARCFNPLYKGFVMDGPDTYRGFAFRTYVAPGLVDQDKMVLKIDYNLEENPAATVRRVLDELVQLDDDLYLGKAHVRWWWRPAGPWQTDAYFTLSK